LAENTFHAPWTFWYGNNCNSSQSYLTRRREYYYPIAIGVSWIAFILWEVYELIYIAYSGPTGFIQSDPWDWVIDLWIDTHGALTICFVYDEFMQLTPN
jgi:hypothetical protein